MMNINAGFISLFGIVFVILKLCGVIDWSWALVTLPFWWWIPLLIFALLDGKKIIVKKSEDK